MTPIELVTAVLATKRLTRLVVDDAITEPVREAVWQKSPPEKIGIGYLVSCHACTSVWAAAAVLAMPKQLRDTLALSEAVLTIRRYTRD
jgi:hypothetical protein